MRKNPTGWRIEGLLQAVAEVNFVEWRRPGRGGSHVIFSAPGVREIRGGASEASYDALSGLALN